MEFTENERFEKLAQIFMGKYGVMAPGKDAPAADGSPDSSEERQRLWDEWNPIEEVLNHLLYAESEIDGLRDQIMRMECQGE